ncbi:unnamed protein product [Coffea canephora]|uniref:Uncharacterized protein n=1 Tax=Coffea canephora TaxID=49390 RepID=A0A068TTH0_COFCA|nr:unnamed protein product [Coffea canephora]
MKESMLLRVVPQSLQHYKEIVPLVVGVLLRGTHIAARVAQLRILHCTCELTGGGALAEGVILKHVNLGFSIMFILH